MTEETQEERVARHARYMARMAVTERIERHVKRATSYLKNASNMLHEMKPISTCYWDLLEKSLGVSLEIIERMPDDWFERRTSDGTFFGVDFGIGEHSYRFSDSSLEAAEKIVAAIKRREGDAKALARIARLEDVTGRTPEEADGFLAKAAELRARHKIGQS